VSLEAFSPESFLKAGSLRLLATAALPQRPLARVSSDRHSGKRYLKILLLYSFPRTDGRFAIIEQNISFGFCFRSGYAFEHESTTTREEKGAKCHAEAIREIRADFVQNFRPFSFPGFERGGPLSGSMPLLSGDSVAFPVHVELAIAAGHTLTMADRDRRPGQN
jgi:hypothetical protein